LLQLKLFRLILSLGLLVFKIIICFTFNNLQKVKDVF